MSGAVEATWFIEVIIVPLVGLVAGGYVALMARRVKSLEEREEARRAEYQAGLQSLRQKVEANAEKHSQAVTEHRLHVGEKYATIAYLKDVETRLVNQISRLVGAVEALTKAVTTLETKLTNPETDR